MRTCCLLDSRHDVLDARRHPGEDDEMDQDPCTLAVKEGQRSVLWTRAKILITSMQELVTARPFKRLFTDSPLHMKTVAGAPVESREALGTAVVATP